MSMSDKMVNTTIEILGKFYSVRCPETELPCLQQAAAYLNEQMMEVEESGKAVGNLERMVIIAALKITCELMQRDQQKNTIMNKINQRLTHLQDKLDIAITNSLQTDLIYVPGDA